MKIATGTVKQGQIIVEGGAFSEGETVTVLGYDEKTFQVTAAERELLLESITQAERGEFVDAAELLAELDDSD